ncbi:MAG: class I SAM-dependent methyltransferase [Pirellulaceae bacterium]
MQESTPLSDNIISFKNSQGERVQGTVVRLDRNSVVAEVYNPYSIVQLSEVLNELRIRRGDRDVYMGRAVVTNLVNTGIMVNVSASLVDPWSDVNDIVPGPELRAEVAKFVGDWETAHNRLRPDFQVCVTNAKDFLEELNRWMDHSETLLGIRNANASADLLNDFVADVDHSVGNKLVELFAQFEEESEKIEPDDVWLHKAFARRELHPLMLCSPFMHRSFTKPLGYAGDYMMVDMILRDPYEGNTSYAKVVNTITLRSNTAIAHRNRIVELTQLLERESRRMSALRRPLRVLNIGCGPAIEIQRFLANSWLSDQTEFELVDFNKPTLEFAERRIREVAAQHGRKTEIEFVQRSVHELLKQAAKEKNQPTGKYDLVYCAGLFDYLNDKICGRLVRLFYHWLSPGGLVFVTNVHESQPIKGFMEYLQEWNLVLRNNEGMKNLAPDLGYENLYQDSTGANVFLSIRKPTKENE